jgi:16S rRNA G527 N7-methylase RsmG
LLDLAAPFLAQKGECFFLKGKKARRELTESQKKWKMTVKTHPSLSDPSGTILQIGDLGYHNEFFAR